MKNTNKKGFTIVELVIVIAVIAILAAVLIPTFVGLVNKANVASDTALIKNLNTALAADTDGCKTMHEALEAAAAYGYDVAKINAKGSNNEILWDSKNNVFCYFNSEKNSVEYIPDSVSGDKATGADLWVIASEVSDTYSTYLYGVENTTVEAIHSLDVGECEGINVEYKGTATVTIRTNGGNLTVDNAAATVNHYGEGENLAVLAVAGNSYHEYGTFFKAEVTSGRVVVEDGGSINLVVVNDAAAVLDVKGNVEALYAPEGFTATGAAPAVSTKITAAGDGYAFVTTLDELKTALENAEVSKIVLGADIVFEHTFADGVNIFTVSRDLELNLNTYTISTKMVCTSNSQAKNNALFNVTKDVEFVVSGAGRIEYEQVNQNFGWGASSSTISNNQGNVVINGAVVVEHLGGTDMAYAIDVLTNGTLGDATLTVNAGVVKSVYRAIRAFCNSTTNTASVIINGGTVVSTNNNAIWMQNPNANANKGVLTVTGGTVESNGYYEGADRYPINANDIITVNITGGTFVQNGVDVTSTYVK